MIDNPGLKGARAEAAEKLSAVADRIGHNPCVEIPLPADWSIPPIGFDPPPSLAGVEIVLVQPNGYICDRESGKIYVSPEVWAKLKDLA